MAASAGESPPLFSWRSGVHVEGTPIWCDARRACDVCFASSVDALSRARHGQVIATQDTALLLEGRSGHGAPILSAPVGRPFTLGSVRLELFPSGYGLGAASLLVTAGGKRAAYAGAINLRPTMLAEAAEIRACDALVVSGRYIDVEELPPRESMLAELAAFCAQALQQGRSAVVLASSVLEGIELAASLSVEGASLGTLAAHRAIHHAAQKLRQRHPGLPPLRRFAAASRPQVIVWLLKSRSHLDNSSWPRPPAIALASGCASRPGWLDRARADAGFSLANLADQRSLLQYIEATGAGEVYLTESTQEAVATLAESSGRIMRRLGGAEQMSLFR